MTLVEQQIDLIVREVMRRLGQPSTIAPNTKQADNATLTLDVAVVSLGQVESRLGGVTQLVVRRGAVITPAVRDLLKEKKVTLTWRVATPKGTATGSSGQASKLTIGVAETKFCPAALIRQLKDRGIEIQQLAQTGLVTVTKELASEVVRGGSLGLLLTDNPLPAVCLANRSAAVRAAVAASVPQTKAAIEAVGVNLLVVDPRSLGLLPLQRMVEAFTSGDTRACPAAFRGSLD